MARTVRDTTLESKAARTRLPARRKPYYRLIDPGCHLGYYKGARGGTWNARYFIGAGKYAEKTLGLADDIQDADGSSVLTFAQAQSQARAWFAVQARIQTGEGHIGPYRVEDAWKDYLAWFGAHRKSSKAMRASVEAHILPALGKIEMTELTTAKLRAWHEKLAATPPRKRSKKGQGVAYRDIQKTDFDAMRRRKASANRVLTILKAALNHAWREGKAATDEPWRRVKPFHNVEAPRIRYITREECQRLVNACAPDFRRLVQAALYTGCRYGELVALQLSDFDSDSATLRIRVSKSGRPRHVYVNEEATKFFRQISVYGKKRGDVLLLPRENGEPWGKSDQVRPLLRACARAGIDPAISFHILRHTYASLMVMAGAPLQVVAHNLGHADTRMTERHYAHLASSYIADAVRTLSPRLGWTEQSNVIPLDQARAASAG